MTEMQRASELRERKNVNLFPSYSHFIHKPLQDCLKCPYVTEELQRRVSILAEFAG